MYTARYKQTGNSCAAATLMIALNEFDDSKPVNAKTEQKLYEQTADAELSKALKVTDKSKYYSSPGNMIKAASDQGLTARLYELKDIDIGALPAKIQAFKRKYVDALKPRRVSTPELGDLLDTGKLQMLVYLDDKPEKMHWVLLRQHAGKYYLYDTAFGTNQRVEADEVLALDAEFQTNRQNNFYGIAIHLSP